MPAVKATKKAARTITTMMPVVRSVPADRADSEVVAAGAAVKTGIEKEGAAIEGKSVAMVGWWWDGGALGVRESDVTLTMLDGSALLHSSWMARKSCPQTSRG